MSMNVVHSGDTFQIYSDSLKTYDKLPLGSYEVNFHKMMGFFLKSHSDLEINESKIYGQIDAKVEKVLKGFSFVNRNFGIILSGRKGIGKSLFARQLSIRAKDYNLPLIIVPCYFPGIADFLSSIDQEVIVLFDEFEKTFADKDDFSPQEEMLSLFDGIDSGKKLFVITCNEVSKLNSYLINRPGRFHYHFTLSNPTASEIEEYMTDKLQPQYHHYIKKLIGFSMTADLTYDILRAIAFELNMGYSFEETLADLNISKESNPKYNIRAVFEDGSVREVFSQYIQTHGKDRIYIWFNAKGGTSNDTIRLDFNPTEIVYDFDNGRLYLDPALVGSYVDDDYFYMDRPEDVAKYEYLKNLKLVDIQFTRIVEDPSMRKFAL